MKRLACAAVCAAASFVPSVAWCAGPLQRYALVIGANAGGAGRPQLQYAISDAEHFAQVLMDLGGVTPGNEILLRQPRLRDLSAALDLLAKRVADAQRSVAANGGRTEVIVYYSGHADDQGLLLGDDRYSYRTLRDRLDEIPADVRIAVLDACASGAFTRLKGGRARPPFLVDQSAEMRGHAFLTSSSETESAQESDRIRASYFTHYLLSGFRGAADVSGDGRVTLNEAYQFAFNETLRRTVDTKGGAQHPSYDINLSGTGDVVMTDVHQLTATLVLGESLEGRFFVRTAAQDLVVELYKPRGRIVQLGIEAGTYEVRLERDKGSLVATAEVIDGARVELDPRQFGQAPAPDPARRRGDEVGRFAVAGRNRVEFRAGLWRMGDHGVRVLAGGPSNVLGGFGYTHWLREDLAVTLTADGFPVEDGTSIEPGGVAQGAVAGLAMPVSLRWNPFGGDHQRQALKPFLSAGLGPVIGTSSGSFVGGQAVSSGGLTQVTLGGRLGGGFDVLVARSLSLGVDASYNPTLPFSEPFGLHDRFSGGQISMNVGWLFGKGIGHQERAVPSK